MTIPDSVVTIEEWAFKSCYALERLEIPDGVSAINDLFGNTDVHADIVFGKGVQSISQGMFHYVSPNSVTFNGKTMAEVQAMANYPWGITDTSIIKTWNVASQEWVESQAYQRASYVTHAELEEAIANFTTKQDVQEATDGLVTRQALQDATSELTTKDEFDKYKWKTDNEIAMLNPPNPIYATRKEIDMKGFVTRKEFDEILTQ